MTTPIRFVSTSRFDFSPLRGGLNEVESPFSFRSRIEVESKLNRISALAGLRSNARHALASSRKASAALFRPFVACDKRNHNPFSLCTIRRTISTISDALDSSQSGQFQASNVISSTYACLGERDVWRDFAVGGALG